MARNFAKTRAVTGGVLTKGGSRTDRSQSFSRNFGGPMARKNFGNDRSRRRARFRQIFIQIRAILAIFRPFEVFTERPIVALVPMWLEFGGGTPSFLAHPLSLPDYLLSQKHQHFNILFTKRLVQETTSCNCIKQIKHLPPYEQKSHLENHQWACIED